MEQEQNMALYGFIGPLSKNSAPQRQAMGRFDVCLAGPKVCPTDIVRPHAAQQHITQSILQNMA